MDSSKPNLEEARNKRLALRSATALTSAFIVSKGRDIAFQKKDVKDILKCFYSFNLKLLEE